MASSPTSRPSIIFLTGSPDAGVLNWGEPQLTSAFVAAFTRFLGEATRHELCSAASSSLEASPPLAKWRAIPFAGRDEREQSNDRPRRRPEPTRPTHFYSFPNAASQRDTHAEDQEHINFLEHSLAVLQNLDSSQIGLPDGTYADTTNFTSSSFGTTLSTDLSDGSLATFSTELPETQVINFDGPIWDLKTIPNARHLQAVHPQTITVNVLAGVIAVQPTRTVKLRRRNAEMDIIEVLVGDETRAGFSITFWLTPIDSQAHARSQGKIALREQLSGLRAGDVVLVTHIALSEFNGSVYGQSLSRRITRNNTSLAVLSDKVVGLPVPTANKLGRVREWSVNFVGKKRAASPARALVEDSKRRRMELPPETQAWET